MKRLRTCLAISLLLAVCLLSACAASPAPNNLSGSNPSQALSAPGQIHEYALPQRHSGIMRPAIDHQGRLWFGEMSLNYLTMFDPRSQHFEQLTPPHGHSGIMGVIVAPDDTIWFAEQYANYIGHYLPNEQRFQTYQLPQLKRPDPADASKTLTLPLAPNDLALDAHGTVWFTEMNADAVGRLDPHSGHIQHYALTTHASAQILNPYGITVDAHGFVWFTESSTNRLGRLDPASSQISFFAAPRADITLMEIASDQQGRLWITSFTANLLLSFDPVQTHFNLHYAPSSTANTNGLYGLAIAPDDQVWVTVPAENKIARLDQAQQRFVYYAVPTPGSFPLGLTIGADRTLWFTEGNGDQVAQLTTS